ncbi:arabinofuranosyltransferase [Micromonospora sp. NPDC003197]
MFDVPQTTKEAPVEDQAAQAESSEGTSEAVAGRGKGRRLGRWVNAGTVAVATSMLAVPVAFVVPNLTRLDPFTTRAAALSIAAALLLAAALFIVAIRWSTELIAGVAAGLATAWSVLMLRVGLYGTPFGFGGLTGDAGRVTGSATRYTTTIASSDTLVPSLPSEYPPFYTWLIGRASVLLDVPAWKLVADFQVLFIAAAVLVPFLLWRRLAGSWVALAITAVALLTWLDPRKGYEVLTLGIFVPWMLDVFARPIRSRMHWLLAGLIGGFIAITYQAWVVYGVFGLIVLMVIGWRTEPDRWAYVRRLGLIAAVAFVVSSWYVVPFLWGVATIGGEQVHDLYVFTSSNTELFPFLSLTPVGFLQLVGLVGLVWFWRSTWWARPILVMIVAVYGYRLVAMLRFVATGHESFLHYTSRLYGILLTVAGVLVLVHAVPIMLRRLRLNPPRMAAAALMAVLLAWSGTSIALQWTPSTLASMPVTAKQAATAHTEPLPGGGYPQYAPDEGRRPWFPMTAIQQAVERELGPDPQPVTLSVDERLFAYVPWPGYAGNDPVVNSTLSHGKERHAEVKRLAGITDPAAFATASANTKFGPVDVFVLYEREDGWAWRGNRFKPAQFSSQHWAVVDDLPEGIVVAIRR